ncbi:NADH-FMN oxidoreductase RutF, flavin reductase (DIM6/NTAB) family [Pseudooceanicola antarcticus]|uniref:Flavin reductase family protein n=1 Tax=Pseudooceanicola antarcticus TaxID=1247613 RepID=A0A285IMA6_9RHOB|nr:flavin reductase family protein [Pseudooceanicola antarcticus]PJE28829.1 flavin reductase family protein [Pseudooceanicola antarcticus]SNY48101.1 NADH-FMN oxidoreductase RutF, flavin reductase (DIM6/NTAB) family [Pseudooceanicola antarcticus]
MTLHNGYHAFDFADLSAREAYKVMIGTIVPRPIAWVTTISPDGVVNAAPYSFFNCLSADPPILALGVENKPDRSFKDTAYNIRMTECFTVNIVDRANVEAMAVTAAAVGPEVDELEIAGLTAAPGDRVACPRIAEAPVAFECERYLGIAVSSAREIILGRIVRAHIREDIIDPATFYSDHEKLDALGRMGGNGYAGTFDYFDLPTPSAEEVLRPSRKQVQVGNS